MGFLSANGVTVRWGFPWLFTYLKDHTLFLKMEQSLCVMVSAKFLYCLLIVKFGLHKISVCGGEVYVFNFGWIIWDSGL